MRRISEKALDAAFDWLVENPSIVGMARGNVLRKHFQYKKVYAELFREANGSVAQKDAEVLVNPRYEAAYEEYVQAESHWEMLRDQRNKCQTIIEAWRSEEASTRFVDKVTQ